MVDKGRLELLSHLWQQRKNDIILHANTNSYIKNDLTSFKKLWQDKDIVFVIGKGSSLYIFRFFL